MSKPPAAALFSVKVRIVPAGTAAHCGLVADKTSVSVTRAPVSSKSEISICQPCRLTVEPSVPFPTTTSSIQSPPLPATIPSRLSLPGRLLCLEVSSTLVALTALYSLTITGEDAGKTVRENVCSLVVVTVLVLVTLPTTVTIRLVPTSLRVTALLGPTSLRVGVPKIWLPLVPPLKVNQEGFTGAVTPATSLGLLI